MIILAGRVCLYLCSCLLSPWRYWPNCHGLIENMRDVQEECQSIWGWNGKAMYTIHSGFTEQSYKINASHFVCQTNLFPLHFQDIPYNEPIYCRHEDHIFHPATEHQLVRLMVANFLIISWPQQQQSLTNGSFQYSWDRWTLQIACGVYY